MIAPPSIRFRAGGVAVDSARVDSSSLRIAHLLTIPLAVLMSIASILGLFADSIYRDNTWSTSGFRGNDLVTAVVAVPLMATGLARARRGSVRGHLVWLGLVAYALYNYLFYLFGAAFNDLFLVYVAIVTMAMWTLILGLIETDAAYVLRVIRPTARLRWVVANMVLIGSFLGIAWIAQSLAFFISGTIPQVIEDSEIHTSVVFALDLTLIVPAMFVAAWLVWRQRAWGVVMAAILMIKATTYTLALISMSIFAAVADVDGAWEFFPVWLGLTATSLASCWLLFSSIQDRSAS